MGQRQK